MQARQNDVSEMYSRLCAATLFDPSFLTPVRSKIAYQCAPAELGLIEAGQRPGPAPTRICRTNYQNRTSQARLKRAGPTIGSKRNFSLSRRHRRARLVRF